MKYFHYLSLIALFSIALINSCSTEEEDTSPPPALVQPQEPEPDPTQYTLTVTAGEGGTVSTEGGTYDEGTEITINATPDEGYEFVGWEGSDSDSISLTITLNSNTSIQALFSQLPVLVLPTSPSKMFTKGVADTLSISFTTIVGFQSFDVSSDFGDIEVIQEPEVGDNEGKIILQYVPNTIQNVDYMTTIAGYDDVSITLIDQNEISNNTTYRIRTQPEPKNKNYLDSSHNLHKSRINVDISMIRFLNQKDNLYSDFCDGNILTSYNQNGMIFDTMSGIAYADVNGDGYDDIFLHPQFSIVGDNNPARVTGFIKTEFELYLYQNGEYVFTDINYGGKEVLKNYLGREILTGDFDNDGDPDFFVTEYGQDGQPYQTDFSYLIINNFNLNNTFDYKINPHNKGAHGGASADIDGDGDLDLFLPGRELITPPFEPFHLNDGNMNFTVTNLFDDNIHIPQFYNGMAYAHELFDVDNDGYIDLILGGHEWEKRSRIYWGSSNGRFNRERKTLIPKVDRYGTTLDFVVNDLNNDGINELIINRSGGDATVAEASEINNDAVYLIDNTIFYSGHYIQILSIDQNRNFQDQTNQFIENNFNNDTGDFCDPNTAWFRWLRLDDYDNDGNIDLWNELIDYQVLQRWEWNGSMFIKIENQ